MIDPTLDRSSGAIATPHATATEAGLRAFERGGTAVDAAVAAAAVLTVVYPHQTSIGGDAWALVATCFAGQVLDRRIQDFGR